MITLLEMVSAYGRASRFFVYYNEYLPRIPERVEHYVRIGAWLERRIRARVERLERDSARLAEIRKGEL